jgi:drug/metabolite transporter (DMT)-like permease
VDRATNLLDIRRIIGGLLGVYGVILLLAGILGSDAEKNKAAGLNINLYVGIALIVASALFWFWALSRPLTEELKEAERPGQGER